MRKMIRPMCILAGVYAAMLTTACAPPPPAATAVPTAAWTVALVDSVAWEAALPGPVLRRVEVRSGRQAHTISGVMTHVEPVAVPGRGIVGIAYDTTETGRAWAFRYDPARRALQRLPLAAVLGTVFAEPAISPDGRHVAYTVAPGNETAHAEVRAFPNGRVVVRGPDIPIPATDALANGARWTGPNRFEVLIDLVESPPRYARVRGTLTGVTAVDTIAAP
jgi:hypothetical protein